MAGLCVVFIHLGMEPGLYFCRLGKFLGTTSGKLAFAGQGVVSIFAMPSFCFISGYLSTGTESA